MLAFTEFFYNRLISQFFLPLYRDFFVIWLLFAFSFLQIPSKLK